MSENSGKVAGQSMMAMEAEISKFREDNAALLSSNTVFANTLYKVRVENTKLRAELAERDSEVARLRELHGDACEIAAEYRERAEQPRNDRILTADDLPVPEIMDAAKAIEEHFRRRGITEWKLGGIQSRVDPEQPRTDAEWKAADRRKRINDLAARYAGHGMDCVLRYSTAHEMAKIAAAARALAAAVVEAEE